MLIIAHLMKPQSLSSEPGTNDRSARMNSSNDSVSLSCLRQSVEKQIDEYVYLAPNVRGDAVGCFLAR